MCLLLIVTILFTLYSIAKTKNADIVSCGRHKNVLDDQNFYSLPDSYEVKTYSSEEGFIHDPKHLLCRIIKKKCFIDIDGSPLMCDELRCEEDFSLLHKLYINSGQTASVYLPLYYFCYDGPHIMGGGFFDQHEIIKRALSMARIVDSLYETQYTKILDFYASFFSSRLYLSLTRNNLNTHEEEFNEIFIVVRKCNLEDRVLAEIKKNETNQFLTPLKKDYVLLESNGVNKAKSILYYIKRYFSIKLYSFNFKKLFKKAIRNYG